jgi:hypothetical protein
MQPDDLGPSHLAEVVADHLGVAAHELRVERSATGKFNAMYFVIDWWFDPPPTP